MSFTSCCKSFRFSLTRDKDVFNICSHEYCQHAPFHACLPSLPCKAFWGAFCSRISASRADRRALISSLSCNKHSIKIQTWTKALKLEQEPILPERSIVYVIAIGMSLTLSSLPLALQARHPQMKPNFCSRRLQRSSLLANGST